MGPLQTPRSGTLSRSPPPNLPAPGKRSAYPVREFYRLIDEALKAPVTPANAVMAARELWDSLKESSDPKTARSFEKNIAKISEGGSSIPLKRLLCELAEKELRPDLQNCLYLLA